MVDGDSKAEPSMPDSVRGQAVHLWCHSHLLVLRMRLSSGFAWTVSGACALCPAHAVLGPPVPGGVMTLTLPHAAAAQAPGAVALPVGCRRGGF